MSVSIRVIVGKKMKFLIKLHFTTCCRTLQNGDPTAQMIGGWDTASASSHLAGR